MRNRSRFPGLAVVTLVVAVAVLVLVPVSAQQAASGDRVVSLIADVSDAAGRLLVGTQHLLDGDDPLSVAVGEIAYDGARPEVASILAAAIEDTLVSTATQLSVRRLVQVSSTGVGPTDLTVRVQGGGGSAVGLFVVQIVHIDGTILASTRVQADLDDSLRSALAPSALLSAGRSPETSGGADDVSDSADAARPVGLDSVVEALSLHTGDEDWFAVDIGPLPADLDGMPGLNVYTRGSTDTYIVAYGPDNPIQLITENDDSEGVNAAVTFPVEAGGRYWIQVRGYSSSVSGAYDLHIETTLLTIDHFEPNDRLEDAALIDAEAGSLRASLRPAGDHDWYRIDPRVLSVPATGGEGSPLPALIFETESALDTYISVYDESGVEIASNDDGGNAGNARTLVPLDGRPLIVEVRGFGSWVEGDYVLTWYPDEIAFDEWEPDNSRDAARGFDLNGGVREYTFSNDSDTDWISFRIPPEAAPEERDVIIETYGEVDTYITLYDQTGTFIVASDDDGSNFNARINRRLPPGTYFVEMSSLYLTENGMPYSVEIRTR